MPGDARSVVRYPTYYLKPDRTSRVVREVVYRDLERLSMYRKRPDILDTASAVYEIYGVYRSLGFSVPELLSTYQSVDKRLDDRPRVESIPWETVPQDLLERCLDSNMELVLTDELLEFLGFSKSESIFDRVPHYSRVVDPSKKRDLVVSPRYNKQGRVISRDYLVYDESIGEFRKALVRRIEHYKTQKTVEEVEYVVDMMSPSVERNSLGLTPRLTAKTVWSIVQCIREYRKEYFGSSYIERLAVRSANELRKERLENEREYAVSLRGKYCEDTSVLWRYGQLSD